jgi:hypothetical protein
MLAGEASLTGVIRNALGGPSATAAAASIQSNGFYGFGSIWAGAAAGGLSGATALAPNITFQSIRATGASSLLSLSPEVTARAVTSGLVGYSSRLFGSSNLGARSGILNQQGALVRIGWSLLNRNVTGTTTYSVFRIAVGAQKFNVFRGLSLYAN